jgi:Putative DNA-binding domain
MSVLPLPTTIEEIKKIIADEVQESLHLDYKDSRAIDKNKKGEIAKDVSAFANSDGGMLIYGVSEKNQLPESIDGGIDFVATKCTREWLEQVINSNISPKIEGIRISSILLSQNYCLYAVAIPKSFRGPHQSSDKKYYKRYNFESVAMEDYEINDVRNRRINVPPLVNIDLKIRHHSSIYLIVMNPSDQVAQDVTFSFSENLSNWVEKKDAKLFKRGLKHFPSKRVYYFMYGLTHQVLHQDGPLPAEFEITASYYHPEIRQRMSDIFHFDLHDYFGSSVLPSDINEQGKSIKESLDKLTKQLEGVNSKLQRLTSISGETGLDLSISTLRNLEHLIERDGEVEKLDPYGRNYQVFKDILGIDSQLADDLEAFFWNGGKKIADLVELDRMTPELIKKIEKHFIDRAIVIEEGA